VKRVWTAVLKVGRILAGLVVVIAGLVMLIGPGPGILVILAGIGILSIDFPAALKLRHKLQAQLPKNRQGKTPIWLLVTFTLLGALSLVLSIMWLRK
jgi:hypothetical protein